MGPDAPDDGDALPDGGDPTSDIDPGEAFSFIVFGDLNGGGCEKNDRVHRLVERMLQTDAVFFVQTGDVIDGYGDTSCFGAEPAGGPCVGASDSADIGSQLAPLMNAPNPAGLNASYFPVRGDQLDPDGTTYITLGTGGALTDGNTSDWFTARTFRDWTTYSDYERMTTYLRISVSGAAVTGEVVTLSGETVDKFQR